MKILITRARAQAEEFAGLLRRKNFEPLFFPVIEILAPESWTPCDRAIRDIDEFDGIIFTSTNAVKFFFARYTELYSPERLSGKVFCAVGGKTKAAIEKYGLNVISLPEKFTAEDLAAEILVRDNFRIKKFLFPHGNLSDKKLVNALREKNFNISPVAVYRTVRPQHSEEEKEKILSMLTAGEIALVSFFSPSAVKNFLDIFPLFRENGTVHIAAIGSTTKTFAEKCGLRVDIIPPDGKFTAERLAEEIARVLGA